MPHWNNLAEGVLSSAKVDIMAKYSIGDHVSWNSEAGRVSGRIIKIHHKDFDYKGYRHRASSDAPQYEIKSDKTDHIAAHRESALTKID
jgi:hypothetical protein